MFQIAVRILKGGPLRIWVSFAGFCVLFFVILCWPNFFSIFNPPIRFVFISIYIYMEVSWRFFVVVHPTSRASAKKGPIISVDDDETLRGPRSIYPCAAPKRYSARLWIPSLFVCVCVCVKGLSLSSNVPPPIIIGKQALPCAM